MNEPPAIPPNSESVQLIFGVPAEWRDFHLRQSLFLERFPHLDDALKTAFIRTGRSMEPIDKFVFLYGRLCAEDFSEVLLCCGNGYGAAGMKLVRTLYERAVTLWYLHENPEELDDFLDYFHVAKYKLSVLIKDTFGQDALPEQMTQDIEAQYRTMKEKFMVTACETCGTKRLNHTWNKLDFVAMAKKTGGLGRLIVPGYYLPMRHAHGTVAGLLDRLEKDEGGGISFNPRAQRQIADDALMTAHNSILVVLRIQDDRFKVSGLKEKIDTCEQDFLDIHRKSGN